MVGKLFVSQKNYLDKVVKIFQVDMAKAVKIPLAQNFKLSKENSPKTEADLIAMENVPYSSAIGSLMYGMTCTRPDICLYNECGK